MKFFLCVIGMVMIIEGLPWFAFPEKMKQIISAMFTQPESLLRKFGLIMMAIGLGLIWIGRT